MKVTQKVFKNLGEIVNPSHTCLVVWDVQNGLVSSIFNREDFLQSLSHFLQKARGKEIPVVYTKITPLPTTYESSWRLYMMMKKYGLDAPDKLPQFMQPGSPEAEIHDTVSPLESDTVLKKHTASIFIGTHFESMLRNRDINTILFTGIATEIGIDSSARDSSNRGFYTVVVPDCVSSADKEMHDLTLKVLPRVCLVIPSTEIVTQWKN